MRSSRIRPRIAALCILMCAALAIGVSASVHLVWSDTATTGATAVGGTTDRGSSDSPIRNCCRDWRAAVGAIGEELDGRWDDDAAAASASGAPHTVRGTCASVVATASASDRDRSSQRAFELTATPRRGVADWWDVTRYACHPVEVHWTGAAVHEPSPNSVVLFHAVDAHDSAHATGQKSKSATGAGLFGASSGSKPLLKSDYLKSVFEVAFRTVTWFETWKTYDKIHSFYFGEFGVSDAAMGKPVSFAERYAHVNVYVKGHRKVEVTRTRSLGGCTWMRCPTESYQDCCDARGWERNVGAWMRYTCDGTGAHSFHTTQVDSVGYDAPDADMRARFDGALATISLPKSQASALCPPV